MPVGLKPAPMDADIRRLVPPSGPEEAEMPATRDAAVWVIGPACRAGPTWWSAAAWVAVAWLVAAHLLALRALDERPRQIYNLGTGAGHSVRQVVEAARRVTGHAIPVHVEPRRSGDPARLVASSDRVQRDLSWRPHYAGLETILASAWEWMKAHPDGYASGRG